MRSLGFTLILALLALLACGLAGWQWTRGNFDTLLGAPPLAVGQRLYTDFNPATVKHIQVSQNGVLANFDLGPQGWLATLPWQDRMDPRTAYGIINFTLGLKIEDFTHRDEINAQQANLTGSGINIRLEGDNHKPLAKYRLGRQTPWLAKVKDGEKPVPTVFILPRDKNLKQRYVYACTGDIIPLFKDGFKYLRDHHPFSFNPNTLQQIRIRNEQGDLILRKETPQSPWRLVEPLELATDPNAVKALIEGLYELQAVKISDRAALTLPSNNKMTKSSQISLSVFDSKTESALEIFPPESLESRDVHATVSDRPNTIFELPLKPESNLISLANLPLTINELRDASLTNLNIESLRGILIQPTNGTEILISRPPKQAWISTINGQSRPANEERIYELLKAMKEARGISFESDAVTDFSLWGLQQPFLKLRFLGQANQCLELAFGINQHGKFFVNRIVDGIRNTSVMGVNPLLIAAIATLPDEWRPARLWSLTRVNLMAIERQNDNLPPLILRYEFNNETWTANQDDKDLSPELNSARANFMLDSLESLSVKRWLPANDEAATKALLKPTLRFKIIEKNFNDDGDFSGLIHREIELAPNSSGTGPRFYYGRVISDNQLFRLENDSYQKIATELFSQD